MPGLHLFTLGSEQLLQWEEAWLFLLATVGLGPVGSREGSPQDLWVPVLKLSLHFPTAMLRLTLPMDPILPDVN